MELFSTAGFPSEPSVCRKLTAALSCFLRGSPSLPLVCTRSSGRIGTPVMSSCVLTTAVPGANPPCLRSAPSASIRGETSLTSRWIVRPGTDSPESFRSAPLSIRI